MVKLAKVQRTGRWYRIQSERISGKKKKRPTSLSLTDVLLITDQTETKAITDVPVQHATNVSGACREAHIEGSLVFISFLLSQRDLSQSNSFYYMQIGAGLVEEEAVWLSFYLSMVYGCGRWRTATTRSTADGWTDVTLGKREKDYMALNCNIVQ